VLTTIIELLGDKSLKLNLFISRFKVMALVQGVLHGGGFEPWMSPLKSVGG